MESHYYVYRPIYANLVQDTNLKYDLSCFLKFHKTCTRILTTEFCLLLKIMSFASKSVRPFTIAVKLFFARKKFLFYFDSTDVCRLNNLQSGAIDYAIINVHNYRVFGK